MRNMETYVALLRGINVGGKNVIRMDSLKEVFESMAFDSVTTYIQSGNVIFRAPASSKLELTEKIAKCLSSNYLVDLRLLLLTAADLRSIVADAPTNFNTETDRYRYDVWFLIPPLTPAALRSKLRLRDGVDTVFEGDKVLYVSRLVSQASKSYLIKISSMEEYQNITIRNWNTTTKILNLIDSKYDNT